MRIRLLVRRSVEARAPSNRPSGGPLPRIAGAESEASKQIEVLVMLPSRHFTRRDIADSPSALAAGLGPKARPARLLSGARNNRRRRRQSLGASHRSPAARERFAEILGQERRFGFVRRIRRRPGIAPLRHAVEAA